MGPYPVGQVSLEKGEIWTQRHAEWEDGAQRHREDSHVQAKERDLEKSSPLTLRRNHPAAIFIPDFHPAQP